jgi:hypothetical protein
MDSSPETQSSSASQVSNQPLASQSASSPPKLPSAKSFPVLVSQFVITGAEKKDWTCIYCKETYRVYNSTRARAHFTHNDANLATCSSAPPRIFFDVRTEYEAFLAKRSRVSALPRPASASPSEDQSRYHRVDQLLVIRILFLLLTPV